MIKKNIVLMLLLGFLQAMVFYAPIATLYRQAQGITLSQITIIESICLALCLLLELPWGIVADKIGYKRTMIFCSLLYFVSKVIFWQAHSFEMFLLERILLAVVISGLSGVDNSILYLSSKPADFWYQRGSANSGTQPLCVDLFCLYQRQLPACQLPDRCELRACRTASFLSG